MLERMPSGDAVLLYVDLDVLRKSGIADLLSRSKVSEEPEYQAFVQKTEFDYRQDLDSVLAAFRPDGVLMIVRGRFHWPRLQAYAREQGGSCYNTLCRMPGSTANRRISFFPLQSGVMALAVSQDSFAAAQLQDKTRDARDMEIPRDPIWFSISPRTLRNQQNLPSGTRMFAQAMQDAEHIMISVGPNGKQFEARLAVTCRSAGDAGLIAAQLERATGLLRDMIRREHQQPNPKDLSGVLSAGAFTHQEGRVVGHWPITTEFLESLAAGSI